MDGMAGLVCMNWIMIKASSKHDRASLPMDQVSLPSPDVLRKYLFGQREPTDTTLIDRHELRHTRRERWICELLHDPLCF